MDLRYSQKVLVWQNLGQNFNCNFIHPNSNVSELSPESFKLFDHDLNNLSYSAVVGCRGDKLQLLGFWGQDIEIKGLSS